MATLQIIQTTKLGHTKTWKIDSKKLLYTYGSSRKSNLVSVDKTFSDFEGAFEYRNDGWHFITFDLQAPTPDHVITENSNLQIKNSHIQFKLIQKKEFIQSAFENMQIKGTEQRKILLVSKNGRLIKTDVKKPHEDFNFSISGKKQVINLGLTENWQEENIEGFQFKSKLIHVEDLSSISKMTSDQIADKESKKMLYLTLSPMAFFLFLGILAPKKKTEIAELPIKTAQNVIVRIDKRKPKK